MISDVIIENYQAIEKAQLGLGMFTVVTGPTGSGKSAVIRAMKLAAFNARGTSYVRHGATSCKVMLGFREEGAAVAIERGGRGRDSYKVAVHDETEPKTWEYTKLAGGVPEEVSQVLRLSRLNFAGQFDSPFLLTESGSEVARTLGELTNVTLIFEAAREANRRRQAIAADLKKAEVSLAQLREQAQRFRTLKAQREALQHAEAGLAVVQAHAGRLGRLKQLAAQLAKAQQDRAWVQRVLAQHEVPSLDKAEQIAGQLATVRGLVRAAAEAAGDAAGQRFAAEQAALAEDTAHKAFHNALVEAGTCPTCGQGVDPMGQLAVQLFGNR